MEEVVIEQADLIEFLDSELGVETDDISSHTALFSSGLVDSFALVTLMMHLEQLGGFRINPGDVTLDNFDTIDKILAFVRRVEA